MTDHFDYICEACGKRVGGCRCPGPNKTQVKVAPASCPDCAEDNPMKKAGPYKHFCRTLTSKIGCVACAYLAGRATREPLRKALEVAREHLDPTVEKRFSTRDPWVVLKILEEAIAKDDANG